MTPRRIVSLLPSATEILCLLGLEDSLVGISHECDFPPEIRGLPVVDRSLVDTAALSQRAIDAVIRRSFCDGKTLYEIDQELLTSLAPDFVIGQELCDVCAVPQTSVLRALSRLHSPPQLLLLHPHSLADVLEDIERIGEATGTSERASRQVASLRERLLQVRHVVQGIRHRPRVAALEWLDPLMASGHWVVEMVHTAGGLDLLGRDRNPSVHVSWQELLNSAPDVLVLMPCGFDVDRASRDAPLLATHRGWERLPAVRSGEIYAVNGGAYFNRSGPRLVTGVEILAEILHPEAFVRRNRPEDYRRLAWIA
jgi:iron complex transport system substrate-binding protein